MLNRTKINQAINSRSSLTEGQQSLKKPKIEKVPDHKKRYDH